MELMHARIGLSNPLGRGLANGIHNGRDEFFYHSGYGSGVPGLQVRTLQPKNFTASTVVAADMGHGSGFGAPLSGLIAAEESSIKL